MAALLPVLLQMATASAEPATFDLKRVLPRESIAAECRAGAPGEITVCARRRGRYRIPLPAEHATGADAAGTDGGTGASALTSPVRCGVFTGERRCGRREAAAYGYGGGRDPLTVAARIVGKALHLDAE